MEELLPDDAEVGTWLNNRTLELETELRPKVGGDFIHNTPKISRANLGSLLYEILSDIEQQAGGHKITFAELKKLDLETYELFENFFEAIRLIRSHVFQVVNRK